MRHDEAMHTKWSVEELKAGADADNCKANWIIDVPMFRSPSLILTVELDDPDAFGMRAVHLIDRKNRNLDEPIPIGYLAPGEGRWALRDLILPELIGRFTTRPECKTRPCHSKARTPDSALGVADTWSLMTYGYCCQHWEEETATYYGDGDLVPVL